MSVKQEFIYTTENGDPPIPIDDWIATLPDEEQQEYRRAAERQQAFRRTIIEDNKLKVTREQNSNYDSYIWDENHVQDKEVHEYKKYDEVWLEYWKRYLRETGTTFEIKKTKV
jgi:hypothetical protein